jgi:hypothetical protein
MLADGRDLLAVLVLEKRLGEARERLADQVIAGTPMTPEHAAASEREALAAVKREHYTAAVRALVKPAEVGISDDADHAARGQRLAEHAALFSHRALLAIPLAGDPQLALPSAPAAAASGG